MKGRVQRLVQRAKTGDSRAFGQLIERYQDKVLYLAFDLLGNWDDAKDAAQEAFLRAFEKLPGFKQKAHFSTWLYRITVNQCMDMHRRRQRSPVDTLDDGAFEINAAALATDNPPFTRELENRELREQIEAALDTLSMKQRTAIVLRYFHELTTAEIAGVMECGENTVRIHFFRAMDKLKTALKTVDKT